MVPPRYVLVYDAAQLRFPDWPLAVAGVIVAVAGYVLLRVAGPGTRPTAAPRMSGTVMVAFGLMWAAVIGLGSYVHHLQLREALAAGRFTTVSGFVYDRPAGTEDESVWVVEGDSAAAWYRYEGRMDGAGFRRRTPGDGGLHDGMRVRIADVNGRIARLEVAVGAVVSDQEEQP